MAYQPLPPLGQDDMAGSLPVVVASDQSAVPVSGTVTANLSATDNAVLDAIEADTTTIAGDTTSIDAKIPALGQALAAASVPVVLTAAQITTLTPPTPQTDALTDTQLRATAVPVSVASIPTHAVTNAGTFAVQNTAATPAGTNNIGDVDVLTVNGVAPAFGSGVRGATVQRVTIATDDSVPVTGTFWQATQPVSLASVPSHAVTNAGTFATQESGALLTAAQLIDDTVFADDAAVTLGTSKGNITTGVAVQTDGTDPTAVSAEGDAAALRTDMNRILLVNQTHPRFWHVSADYASAQTNASVKAAPGAGLSLYITDLTISNGATAGNITLLDGSGGTVLYEVYPAINGGAVLSLRSPIKLTANTALCLTSTSCTTHSIFVSGYIAA